MKARLPTSIAVMRLRQHSAVIHFFTSFIKPCAVAFLSLEPLSPQYIALIGMAAYMTLTHLTMLISQYLQA